MELFYYCLSAPKEDANPRHTRLYVPDPINYDEKTYEEAGMVDSDSEVEQFSEKEPLTYSDLNQSLDEVQAPGLELQEPELSPVDEEDLAPAISPEEVPHEHAANLLRRHNSRKFKTPSFKWKKKSKAKREPEPYYVPTPSAPEMTMSDSPGPVDDADLTQDDNLEGADDDSIVERKISVDSLNDKLVEKESEAAASVAASDSERERLVKDALFYQERLRDAEELLNRYKTDNVMLQQRVDMAERDRGALQHGNFVELEKVREEYQEKMNELSLYPEQLSSAEARREHAEAQTDALQAQLADKNETVAELNHKIDLFQGQIAKLKDKFHSVNEDNIELSNKAHSHEKKQMAADMHNKNLMDLVSKKDQTVESQQLRMEELISENADLNLQLESALGDCRRQIGTVKEKSLLKERGLSSRNEELEAELGRATSTQSQLKRLKEEAEKRSQQRINEMRERLEQANNTTRSMQNYVNFLKQSYSSVFGDTTGDYNTTARLSPTFRRAASPSRSPQFTYDYS